MFQRNVSLLLIAGLFASQLAAIPHGHVGVSAGEHDANPHFHWGWFSHDHHTHHQPAAPGGLSGQNHDADAVFLPTFQSVLSIQEIRQPGIACPWETGVTLATVHGDAWFSLPSVAHWHPPDEVLDASGCYLTLRHLRI